MEGNSTERKTINKLITDRLRNRAKSIAMSKEEAYLKLKSESSVSSIHRSTSTLRTLNELNRKHGRNKKPRYKHSEELSTE